jgi:hypothetical protein
MDADDRNLTIVRAALPLRCSRSNDPSVRESIHRSILNLIGTHARLVGDAWAIGMHEEATRVDVAAVVERSKDLRWLWRRMREEGLGPLSLDGRGSSASGGASPPGPLS